MSAAALKQWATTLTRTNVAIGPLGLVAAVADQAAAALGAGPLSALVLPAAHRARPGLSLVAPPDGWADPWLVGAVHERAVPAGDRRARGAWYTPRPVVEGLVALAGSDAPTPRLVVDPTCGGGAFLLAGLDLLTERGLQPDEAVDRILGLDIDRGAVAAARLAVLVWLTARLGEQPGPALVARVKAVVRPGDAFTSRLPGGRRAGTGTVLVLGNPPFASPLKRGAVPATAAGFRAGRDALLGPYADLAAAHLLRAVEAVPPGSTVALVQPLSVLSSRDTEALRRHLDRVAPLRALWAAREALFDAAVRTCAPVLTVGSEPSTVTLAAGPDVQRRSITCPDRWSHLAADALGAPPLPPLRGRLGDLATATAGFRDEHYGLVAACRELGDGPVGTASAPGSMPAPAGPTVESAPAAVESAPAAVEPARFPFPARLVTVGAVDPLSVSWGETPIRFGGVDRHRPVIDRDALPDRVQGWYDRQLRPKVLLATQARILEPVIDRAGDLVPATPLIAVHADPADLDRVAAVLLSPPVVLWAWRRWLGTALTVDAVKLAARQVVELPLPDDHHLWELAAARVATGCCDRETTAGVVREVARLMTRAYGAGDEVYHWWEARLADTERNRTTR